MRDRYFLSVPDLTIDRAEITCITRVHVTASGETMRIHHINLHRNNGFILSFRVSPEKSREVFQSATDWFVKGLPMSFRLTQAQLGLIDSEVSE